MNYKFLDGYCPRQKRGVDSIITGALGGLGLIGDTIGQTSTNAYNAHLQQGENQKNREFQAQESENAVAALIPPCCKRLTCSDALL